jgi:hypothetical protein
MLFPPIAIVPFMPIATKSIGITKTILPSLILELSFVLPYLTVRQFTRGWFDTVIFCDGLCVRGFQTLRNPLRGRHANRWPWIVSLDRALGISDRLRRALDFAAR